jgi:TRAP-type C4-dicarboxylate transport system permease large subunit
MKQASAIPRIIRKGFLSALLLIIVLGLLFWRSFLPDFVHFANDGPLGQQNVDWLRLPSAVFGMWDDLNDVGFGVGTFSPSVWGLIRFVLGPVGFAKFLAPIALLVAGLGALIFFRALKLTPLAALLGALAAMLNSSYFSDACWGTASHQIALGMVFLALALFVSNTIETPWHIRWTRLALAGLCVGINVIEAADIGALYSIFIAAFVFYKSATEAHGTVLKKTLQGIGRVTVIAVFAGFIAYQMIISLVGTSIQGVAGTAQDSETKLQHWDWATQWSLPKLETLGIFVPGVFGYKMDTPKDMLPQLQPYYEGGVYWGGMGRSPEIDRFFDSGATGTPPAGMMRFSGGGNYCGVLVCLLAIWTIAQSLRKKVSPFSDAQKKNIWFWAVVLVASLLLAWGRFAPVFYGILYKLPYFSTIRNPAKFIIFLNLALVILFTYGVHALSQRYLNAAAAKSASLMSQLKIWWTRATTFDRKWTFFSVAILGSSVFGWLIFASEKNSFVGYLKKMGFPDDAMANQIAAFSLGQAGWFLLLLTVSLLLVTFAIAGYFSGPRARLGGVLLGAFLIFDLGRADLPYVIHWDYKQKYEVGTLNPIVEFLRQKPYEHRVAALPFRAPEGMELFDQVYRIEWMQHHFPYYNIQCLDWIQMPRLAEDLKTYLEALSPRGTPESAPLFARRWQLSNTEYLLGPAGYLDVMNQQLDPVQKRFRILQRFEIAPKPGILQPQRLEELTAVPDANGRYALFDFTGALPRAKLYSNWQVNTNDSANLKTLADLNFDPAKTVLISTPQKDLPASATNENSGTVTFRSYAPKKIVFDANASTPAVLLLNDKYDPNWRVTVDGAPAKLLRCNFLMRGVAVPSGQHTVEFDFALPNKPLYITLAAFGMALLLCGLLVFFARKQPASAAK